jgi:hypothetical protein
MSFLEIPGGGQLLWKSDGVLFVDGGASQRLSYY